MSGNVITFEPPKFLQFDTQANRRADAEKLLYYQRVFGAIFAPDEEAGSRVYQNYGLLEYRFPYLYLPENCIVAMQIPVWYSVDQKGWKDVIRDFYETFIQKEISFWRVRQPIGVVPNPKFVSADYIPAIMPDCAEMKIPASPHEIGNLKSMIRLGNSLN